MQKFRRHTYIKYTSICSICRGHDLNLCRREISKHGPSFPAWSQSVLSHHRYVEILNMFFAVSWLVWLNEVQSHFFADWWPVDTCYFNRLEVWGMHHVVIILLFIQHRITGWFSTRRDKSVFCIFNFFPKIQHEHRKIVNSAANHNRIT